MYDVGGRATEKKWGERRHRGAIERPHRPGEEKSRELSREKAGRCIGNVKWRYVYAPVAIPVKGAMWERTNYDRKHRGKP
jgi:hypothetical protein